MLRCLSSRTRPVSYSWCPNVRRIPGTISLKRKYTRRTTCYSSWTRRTEDIYYVQSIRISNNKFLPQTAFAGSGAFMSSPNKIARTTQMEGVHSVHHQTTQTLITDLPADVYHHISSYLSLKDLARMALSSKTWRFICRTAPYLKIYIDEQLPGTISAGSIKRNCDYMNFVERLLVLRRGTQIERFIYNTPVIPVHPYRVETLIINALFSKVQELDLTFPWNMTCDLSREIFNLSSLKILQLNMKKQYLELPTNAGCTKLQSLSISHAKLRHEWPLNITQCSSLKTLSLLDCSGIFTLNISNESLEKIHIRDPKKNGGLCHIDITCQKLSTLHLELFSVIERSSFKLVAPDLQFLTWIGNGVSHCHSDFSPLTSLQTATMDLSHSLDRMQMPKRDYIIQLQFGIKFFDFLSHVKSLHLCSLSMQILSFTLMLKPEISLAKVESMELSTHFSVEENQYMFYLLWRLSNLKAFVANQETNSPVSLPLSTCLKDKVRLKCQNLEFPQLKTSEIRLQGSGEDGSEEIILELVKRNILELVKGANMLEKLTVKYSQKDFDIAKRLSQELQSSQTPRLWLLPD